MRDDRIVAVGGLIGMPASALMRSSIAPGFIDVHTHDDYALLAKPDMDAGQPGDQCGCR